MRWSSGCNLRSHHRSRQYRPCSRPSNSQAYCHTSRLYGFGILSRSHLPSKGSCHRMPHRSRRAWHSRCCRFPWRRRFRRRRRCLGRRAGHCLPCTFRWSKCNWSGKDWWHCRHSDRRHPNTSSPLCRLWRLSRTCRRRRTRRLLHEWSRCNWGHKSRPWCWRLPGCNSRPFQSRCTNSSCCTRLHCNKRRPHKTGCPNNFCSSRRLLPQSASGTLCPCNNLRWPCCNPHP